MYSHQLAADKQFYDDLCKVNTKYKYMNGGTFMGYKTALLQLFDDILDVFLKEIISSNNTLFKNELTNPKQNYDNTIGGNDQSWIGHYLTKNYSKYNIQLDYLCDIFYVIGTDSLNITNFIDSYLCVKQTGRTPSIIHIPCKEQTYPILLKLYNQKYNIDHKSVLLNKRYSWNTVDSITFLENGQLGGWGGHYIQLDTFAFQLNFGRKHHILVFNNDYTEFISIRKDDNSIVKGRII